MRVTVIGTGYVGTVTGACLAWLGHRVTCVDTDKAKVDRLRAGISPIYEPGLDDLLAARNDRGRMVIGAASQNNPMKVPHLLARLRSVN